MDATRPRPGLTRTRYALTLLGTTIIVAAVALPAIGASPSPGPSGSGQGASPGTSASPSPSPSPSPKASPSPSPSPRPKASPSPVPSDVPPASPDGKPGKGNAKAKTEEIAVTLRGVVSKAADDDGGTGYRLTVGSTVYDLHAGPPWFYGDAYPLAPYVGKTVTVTGEQEVGTKDVDVLTVDGKTIREPGRPPWAGGWHRVGAVHPGWSQEKADRFKAKFGDCFPPGQCKREAATDGTTD